MYVPQENWETTLERKIKGTLSLKWKKLPRRVVDLKITLILQKGRFSFLEEKEMEKYNIWYTEQVIKQFNESKDPADVEVLLNLSQVSPLHAKCIFEMSKHLQGCNDLIINGFKAPRITEAVEKVNEVFHSIENPFIICRSEQH